MSLFARKLHALLAEHSPCPDLQCLNTHPNALEWWNENKSLLEDIASASDHINFELKPFSGEDLTVKHPISGQDQTLTTSRPTPQPIPEQIYKQLQEHPNPHIVFWWMWRFFPEQQAKSYEKALLYPQHRILPDCPKPSYRSTVSALAGAMTEDLKTPYLLIFTFSPVQEFIKASRKFVDFWAGSYLLHYLSAKLCWLIANRYGPDAVITPSLWGQEIIDALMVQELDTEDSSLFAESFRHYLDQTPVERFENYPSLSTAGFPNTITALIPQDDVQSFGDELVQQLKNDWEEIATKVRQEIRKSTIEFLTAPQNLQNSSTQDLTQTLTQDSSTQDLTQDSSTQDSSTQDLTQDLTQDSSTQDLTQDSSTQDSSTQDSNTQSQSKNSPIQNLLEKLAKAEGKTDTKNNPNRHDIEKLKKESCWTWRSLWEVQIDKTWDSYWAAIPLGHPNKDFFIESTGNQPFDKKWIDSQETIAPSRNTPTPTEAENNAYKTLNVGTWWANVQKRLGDAIQAVKNTRTWRIGAAPGERSTISGQFTALHPFYLYHRYPEGGGLSSGSLKLFWELMALVYPGLFNGSEKLNALEVTKRMAWVYGGVADALGIDLREKDSRENESEGKTEDTDESDDDELDYERLMRFPNLSSIAAAGFAQRCPEKVQQYWHTLSDLIKQSSQFSRKEQKKFYPKTRRPFQVPKVDKVMAQQLNLERNNRDPYNGVVFSSKWLADDMGLNESNTDNTEKVSKLRTLVHQAHKKCHFGESSPADWWVIIAADGDGMGQYVSGRKLKEYRQYIQEELIADKPDNWEEFLNIYKRMGPATHIGLNRALLDFSNRLVPYLTEQRFCGRVVYSGGDDVMAVLPLTDLPEYLLSLRAAWSGDDDPKTNDTNVTFTAEGGYWKPQFKSQYQYGLPNRHLFTMGKGATMSAGIIIAHKSVPLPTVLESLWDAESERAKKLQGNFKGKEVIYPQKDGLCFRVIYGGGNTLEALMKGGLLSHWWQWVQVGREETTAFAPVLYRLAEELPRHAVITENYQMVSKAARVILTSRDEPLSEELQDSICDWLDEWEKWAFLVNKDWDIKHPDPEKSFECECGQKKPLGIEIKDLAKILRFSAFWIDKMAKHDQWVQSEKP